MAKYKRVLLKLSGESLMGEKQYGIDEKRLAEYAAQIQEIHEQGVQIGIVIGGGNGTVSDTAVNDIYATKTGINAAKSPEIATTIPQTKEETDTKGKQETEKERDRGTETKAERDRDREKEIEKDKETENRRKAGKETENEMPPVPSNGVFQAPPVVVSGLSFGNFGNSSEIKECYSEEKGTYPEVIENPSGEKGNPQRDNGRNSIPPQGVTAGGSSETLLHMNLQTIDIRKEQTVNAITALARRKELGGPGGTLWKILSNEYRPTLLKKNEPGDYILWALNHPTEFENTYNGTLKKLVRGR